MTFEEILDQAIAMLQRRGRLTYGALKRQFQLDDAYLEDVKAELIEGQRLAADEDGRVLAWTGGASPPPESGASPPPQQEAPRAGLGMVEALGQLNIRLKQDRDVELAVRLGIHTGLVVVGEVGGGARQEQLALGETPNLAARLQGIAAPNTVVISAATVQLLGGFFACQPLGAPLLKGLAQPLAVYRVLDESMARQSPGSRPQDRVDPAG